MRQAGRYLPEYQEVRRRHSFVEMCSQPDLAVEVSLQPWRRFGFDAVIVFYDILFLVEAMGSSLRFTEDGPRFDDPVTSKRDVDALHAPDIESCAAGRGTGAVLETLRRLRGALPEETALLGFAGAPFTLASYLVEGSFGRGGDRIRRFLYEEPALLEGLLERLANATADYLRAQVEAGADAVQLFDTWAGLLGPAEYRRFVAPYQQEVFRRVRETGAPAILYVNGSTHLLDEMGASGANVLSLDWRHELPVARARLGDTAALQGNLDPALLFAAPDVVRARVEDLLDSMRGDPGYIVNLGHGILKDTPVRSVETLVETVRSRNGS